jgi:hypothetical protein
MCVPCRYFYVRGEKHTRAKKNRSNHFFHFFVAFFFSLSLSRIDNSFSDMFHTISLVVIVISKRKLNDEYIFISVNFMEANTF